MNANTPANPTTNQHIVGSITGLYGDVLQGWALDRNRPDERLAVEIYIDGACVSVARADQFQGHSKGELEGDGFHGFAVALQKNWLNSAEVIAVRVANHAIWLANTLQLPSLRPTEPGPAASQVWYDGGLVITGWAWDPDSPARQMRVSVREGDRVLASAAASKPHPALINRDSADHGFSLDLPWDIGDGELHELQIENDLGQELTGSPVTVRFRPEGIESLLRQHWPGNADDPALALLTGLARDQDRRAPRSIGFARYPEWFALFQQPGPLVAASPTRKAAILLIESENNAAAVEASLASITNQRWPAQSIIRAPADNLLSAVEQLLQSGADAIVPLHAGDRLATHALDHLLPLLDDSTAWVFADCDCDGPNGERSHPWLKPVWDIDLFLGADIFTPGAIFSAEIMKAALALLGHRYPREGGDPATATQSSDWHQLIAAIALATEQQQATVVHLPRVLYHRNYLKAASPADALADSRRELAMQWLAGRLAPGARVSPLENYPALLRTQWPLPSDADLPRVSLIVPTRDQLKLLRTCVEGLLSQTDYPNLEIIVVDNQSTDAEALAYLSNLPDRGVVVLRHPHPFNYSAINNRAVEHATGEIVGLINNDIEVIHPDWLREMVSHLLRPNIGAVGAKLLWPNGMVQHGGVVVGINGLAAHIGNSWREDEPGYLGFNQLARRQSAVTAACLLLPKALYENIGGLDEKNFPVTFNDVELCLRIHQSGRGIVWTPHAQALHAESASRGKDHTPEKVGRAQREQKLFIGVARLLDPHYHPALNHDWHSGPYRALQNYGHAHQLNIRKCHRKH